MPEQQPLAAMPQAVPSPRINHSAVQYGEQYEKGVSVLLVGHPGCLAGDTVIQYKRGKRGGSRKISLEELYKKFNGIKTRTAPWTRLQDPTYTYSIGKDGIVYYNRIIDVMRSGVKRCFAVRTGDGQQLTCTTDHRFLLEDFTYCAAKSLLGKRVILRGTMQPTSNGGKKKPRVRSSVYVTHHPYGCLRTVHPTKGGTVVAKKYKYKQVHRARLVVEAAMNGLTYAAYVTVLRNDEAAAATLQYLNPRFEVHHRDGDATNDARENLEVLTKAAHARRHAQTGNFHVDYYKVATIVAVTDLGEEDTYDIAMQGPDNNFDAGGFFVHNSWKSTWAAQWPGVVFLSIASEGGDDSVKPASFGPVMQRLISNSKMPECPPTFNTVAPHIFPVRSTQEFKQYVKDIIMNYRAWGVCTVVVDSLTYLIDLWIRELIMHKTQADANWMRQVKKRGGEFLGPPEWGLLNMFLAQTRVDLGNLGLNVIWTTLQQDKYRTDPNNMQDQTLIEVLPMITGRNKITLPGACKLHIWAEKQWVADDSNFGRQRVEPIYWTSSTTIARWVRHRYGLKFAQGKLIDPEYGTLPTFRAVWAELQPYIYVG